MKHVGSMIEVVEIEEVSKRYEFGGEPFLSYYYGTLDTRELVTSKIVSYSLNKTKRQINKLFRNGSLYGRKINNRNCTPIGTLSVYLHQHPIHKDAERLSCLGSMGIHLNIVKKTYS